MLLQYWSKSFCYKAESFVCILQKSFHIFWMALVLWDENIYLNFHFVCFPFFVTGLFQRTILVSGSLLSPNSRIISPDLVREEISRQMACHLDVEGGDVVPTTTSNTSEPSSVLRDISNCLDRKPIEALLGIRLPFVR